MLFGLKCKLSKVHSYSTLNISKFKFILCFREGRLKSASYGSKHDKSERGVGFVTSKAPYGRYLVFIFSPLLFC
jgi:hypothetical protein